MTIYYNIENKNLCPSIRVIEIFNQKLLKKTGIYLDRAIKIAVNNTKDTDIDAKLRPYFNRFQRFYMAIIDNLLI